MPALAGPVNLTAPERITRHLLLMTATPHNGKEEDFQLFMALLDGDRFEGGFRDGAHTADVSDLMRRMVKENLLTVSGRKAANDEARQFLHRGLAERNFERRFQLADYVIVTDAALADGLLSISLKRELPEALKPRTIAINTGEKLIEGKAKKAA